MKKGAGSDPFGSDGNDTEEQDVENDVDDAAGDVLEEPVEEEALGGELSTDDAAVEEAIEGTDSVAPELPQTGRDDGGVPWVYTRSTVKQDREMVQYYLRDAVQAAEEDLVDAVEDELGASLSKTDVREAAVVTAMRRPEIVAEELARWGFESE